MDRGKTSMQRRRGVTPGFLESGLCHRDVKRGAQGVPPVQMELRPLDAVLVPHER